MLFCRRYSSEQQDRPQGLSVCGVNAPRAPRLRSTPTATRGDAASCSRAGARAALTWLGCARLSAAPAAAARCTPALGWPPAARLSETCAGTSSAATPPAPGGRGAYISAESKCKVGSPWSSYSPCHRHLTWKAQGEKGNLVSRAAGCREGKDRPRRWPTGATVCGG